MPVFCYLASVFVKYSWNFGSSKFRKNMTRRKGLGAAQTSCIITLGAYNPGQNICKKATKSSKTEQGQHIHNMQNGQPIK